MNSESEVRNEASVSKGGRGLQFPAISLREAVQRAKIIWDQEKRNSVPYDILAQHWKYSPKSSGARGCVAALTRYGLIESIGGDYRLTNRALSILLADESEKNACLREAALSPRCFNDLWSKYGLDLPSDQSLAHKLIMEGYNASTVGSLVKDWKDTIEFASLRKGDIVEDDHSQEKTVEAVPLFRNGNSPQTAVPQPTPSPSVQPVQTMQSLSVIAINPTIRYLPIPLEIGDAQIPMGMTENDFELLFETLKLWKKRIVAPEVIEKAPAEVSSPSLNVEDY